MSNDESLKSQNEFEEMRVDSSDVDERHQQLYGWLNAAVDLIRQIFNLTDQAELVSMLELVGKQAANPTTDSTQIVPYTSLQWHNII